MILLRARAARTTSLDGSPKRPPPRGYVFCEKLNGDLVRGTWYAGLMKYFAVILLLVTTPASAQEEERGRDLMTEALRLFMKGLMQEVEPALDDLGDLLDNLDAYHPPEVLPNGDIIIRRKTPLDRELEEGGEVEL